ncbi:baseplate J/gp47 family protein [Luteirhabdus pelagi]|uniref:baseplate J/gp47 family protein n=1 Tax=Luteirhabdus pelagi TaxID=2792783 RepID=UPI00193AAD0F|nr:baseplate J/gp47 family protein [Luteirhabdus pelagi]
MAKNCDHTFLTQHGGTTQAQRESKALSPESVLLNDFSTREWMQFALRFAKEVNYFDTETNAKNGDWQAFFSESENIEAFLSSLENSQDLTPHLTLFVSFLKLLDISKERFNAITKRHLDFYYGEILQIEKKAAVKDKVHLLFELAKNTSEANIEENTTLEAGKDAEGNRLQYETESQKIINQTKVAQLKSIYHHRKKAGNPKEHNGIFVADAVNSIDGKGKPFKETPQWYPFGYPTHFQPEQPLEVAQIGFSIACPTLRLAEGERHVSLVHSFEKKLQAIATNDLVTAFEVYATGEKGWLGPFPLNTTTSHGFRTGVSDESLNLWLTIPKTEGAVIPYSQDIHGGQLQTDEPVFRFLLKTASPEFEKGYTIYTKLFQQKLLKSTVQLKVEDVKNLQLRNDLGAIAADKPFFPFTTQPMQRSAFYIDSKEVFAKKWESISIQGNWLKTPNDFKDHYIAYRKDGNNFNLSPKLYHHTLYFNFDSIQNLYISPGSNINIFKPTTTPLNLYVSGNDYFKMNVSIENKETFQKLEQNQPVFADASEGFQLQNTFTNTGVTTGYNGPLKLSLKQSFLHDLFPQIYALALSSEEDTVVPNQPYTPLLESLSVNYTASQARDFKNANNNTEGLKPLQLFHEHPFGQSKNDSNLFPVYCTGGELYIGLEQAVPQQQVSLLFQILEGSENPLADTYTADEKIEWAMLTETGWMDLDSEQLLGDTTDNFLKTGIVTLAIPSEATLQTTELPSGHNWLRAKSPKSFDASAKIIGVHAQVITAEVIDNQNIFSHLEKGLPAETISKLTLRDAKVKKVTQPYNSFGGRAEESDDSYYKRISERIRHRDRAITQWDYEHLILEQFKDIHRVKCLNHTDDANYQAPGAVTVLVLPNTENKNVFDIFQPRVSTAKRNEISDYINNKNSFFVTAKIENPQYEEVRVSLKVKFHKGFDALFYTKQLDEDIKKYLSPWTFETISKINFGGTVHRSTLISWMETLPYVDYLDSVVLEHRISETTAYTEKIAVTPSSPKSILVSAKQHHIEVTTGSCKSKTPKQTSQCLP